MCEKKVEGSVEGVTFEGGHKSGSPQQPQSLCTGPGQAPTLGLTDLPSRNPWGGLRQFALLSRRSHSQLPPSKAFQILTTGFANMADISSAQNIRE